jgi:hypothetical protein
MGELGKLLKQALEEANKSYHWPWYFPVNSWIEFSPLLGVIDSR